MKSRTIALDVYRQSVICTTWLAATALLMLAQPTLAKQTGNPSLLKPQSPQQSTPDPYFQDKSEVRVGTLTPIQPGVTGSKQTPSTWSPPLTPIPTSPQSTTTNHVKQDVKTNGFDTTLTSSSIIRGLPLSPMDQTEQRSTKRQSSGQALTRKEPATQPSLIPDPTPSPKDREESLEPFEPGKVLAIVGGDPIFVGDLMFEINQVIEKHMPTAPPAIKARERRKMIPLLLPKFVEAKILFKGAVQRLPEEFQENIEQVIDQAGEEFDNKALPGMMESAGIKSVGEFDAHLRAQSSSLRQLRRAWSIDQLTKHFVGRQLASTEQPTHQEMLEQYRDNLASYEIPAKAKWEQVMIRFDKASSRREAKRQIVDMGNRIVNGANLAALAKKESHGFRADQGGQHDWTTKGALVLKELDEAIFSLPIGELSDIIESRDGWHIIRVKERSEATRKPFLEAQVEIKQRLIEKKRQAAFLEYIKELKRDIPVDYLDTNA